MKPGVWLVNTARGGVVEETALLHALRHGPIAAAGLDCFAKEPLPPDHPLRRLPNVVLTPHLAGGSVESRLRVAQQAVRNLLAVLDGGPIDPRCVANPAVLREEGGYPPR